MTKLVFVIVFIKEKIGGSGKIISYLENIGKLFKFKKLKHSKKKQNKIKLVAEAAGRNLVPCVLELGGTGGGVVVLKDEVLD